MNSKCCINLHTRRCLVGAPTTLPVGETLADAHGVALEVQHGPGRRGLSPGTGLAVTSALTVYQAIFSPFSCFKLCKERAGADVDESNIDEGFIRSVSMAKFEKELAGFSACSLLSLSLTLSFCSRLWEIPVSKLWARTHSMLCRR